MRIAVIGGGSWGSAIAHSLASKDYDVRILVRSPEQAEAINSRHTNPRYLGETPLHPALKAHTTPAGALEGTSLCILAVPCQHLRGVLRSLRPHLSPGHVLVNAGKGIERGSLSLMSAVVAEETPEYAASYAILSGPSFASELIRGLPTAVVLGCADRELGETLRETFSTAGFRVYSSTDVCGVELGGALKNVMALAAGMSDGLGFGHNSRAALITRGLAEMSRLGEAMGARASTFMGLSGMGDLVLSCTGDLSRNRRVGLRLGGGESLESILASMHEVAEGVPTTEAACALALRHGAAMPICETVHAVIHGKTDPALAVSNLMSRSLKEE
ncbi:NAD(P)-dependent glycerol-3-phosphate dehydrogenase [Desulfovibrio sp. OttesenSCG-928-I05]|nr:NAD(P)-dependent glycerol-3-phosphate dehydrogenase [Desulfovibrio sp. OttesenSCG-928-I05]